MELKIPTWDELFMRHAYLISSKSKDSRTKIGCVLVKNNIIISEGYNGMPRGVNDLVKERYERPLKYSFFAHAEANSVYNCARHGISTLDSVAYTNGMPCSNCCMALINAGIKEVVLHKQWDAKFHKNEKWLNEAKISEIMLNEAKIKFRFMDVDLGVKSLCDGEIVEI